MTRSRRSEGNDGDHEHPGDGNRIAPHIRERQRAVAQREAARLARPETQKRKALAHADKRKSAVSSTPFGIHKSSVIASNAEEAQEWCGPFSVARQIIAQREEAKKRKLQEENEASVNHPMDALMDLVQSEQEKKAHPSLTWKGIVQTSTPSSIYAKRQKRIEMRQSNVVPSLSQLCVNFLVDNWDMVESLGEIGNDCRVAISKELVKRNQLDAEAFESLISPDMECLDIVDCAGIPQDNMANVFSNLKGLRYLVLTNAGRCFGPKSVNSLLLNSNISLCCLSISGAYLLQDNDAASLIKASSSSLQSINFDTCPLLGSSFVDAICNDVRESLLELSLQNLSFTTDCLQRLSSCNEPFNALKSLTLKSLPGLQDATLTGILKSIGNVLESLDVSQNYDLTDDCLSAIREFNPGLRSLTLNGVKELTSLGLETLFTNDLEGLPPPPKLKVLNLSSCDHQAVTDRVLKLATASATILSKEVSGSRGGGLLILDIQGSTLVSDTILEHLVEGNSALTLTELNISYCPLISDKGLGYFVSKVGSQLSKIHVWGCAQLTDEFFDGHARVNDSSLEVVGAWMKRSGARSLR